MGKQVLKIAISLGALFGVVWIASKAWKSGQN